MMKALRNGLLVLLAALPLFATAAPSAHDVVKQTTDQLLADLKRDFAVVRHVKPAASRADSAELYVMATGFRGQAEQAPDA